MAKLEGSNWEERRCGHATHGMSNTPTWKSWMSMRQRCNNSSNIAYHNYGGRGIKVCDRWMNSFENFYEDMGERPEGTSLERIDNDADYCAANCRWASPLEQSSNQRNNRLLTHKGETLTVMQWSRRTGLSKHVIGTRLKHGWSIKKTLETPRHGSRAEAKNSAKLTEDQVLAIRTSSKRPAELAAEYGVSPSNITAILKRKSWRHI
jgi:hypothetical protein